MERFVRLREAVDGCARRGEGLTVADILGLPEALQHFLQWVMRQREVRLPEVAAYLPGAAEGEVCGLLGALVQGQFLQVAEGECGVSYQVRLRSKPRRSPAALWDALG